MRHLILGGCDLLGYPLPHIHHAIPNRLGALWWKARTESYLTSWPGWRAEVNAVLAETHSFSEAKKALDEWAECDLIESAMGDDYSLIFDTDREYKEWLCEDEPVNTDSLRPIGPIQSCSCEDYPCCGHTDDYAYAY